MVLLLPPLPSCCPQASFPHTRLAAPTFAKASYCEDSAAGDAGAGADGAGAEAPRSTRSAERAACLGTAVSSLPHPAAGGLLHRPAW